jgi:hypothetical protein
MNQCCVDYSGQYIRSSSTFRQHLDYVNQKVRRKEKRRVSQTELRRLVLRVY